MSTDDRAQTESGSGGSLPPPGVRLYVPHCVMQNETKQHENIVMVFLLEASSR